MHDSVHKLKCVFVPKNPQLPDKQSRRWNLWLLPWEGRQGVNRHMNIYARAGVENEVESSDSYVSTLD